MKKQTKKRRGLGSLGVDALLTTQADADIPNDNSEQIVSIETDRIRASRYQPRKRIDEDSLRELAESIKHQGLLQPIVIREQNNTKGHYELIAGERRWRAAKLAGLAQIPAILKKVDESTAAAIALVENIQREDLSAIEEAAAIKQLLVKFDMTHEQVAIAIGRSRPAVSNLLRLLEVAPEVREWLMEGRLEMAHARTLLQLEKNEQVATARLVIAQKMSVRELEDYVRELLDKKNKSGQKKQRGRGKGGQQQPEVAQLERELSERMGAPVKLKHNKAKGKGSLEIYYTSLDELDNILSKLG